MARQFLDVVLGEGADHQAVEVAREHGGGVPERLAPAELEVGGRQVEPGPSELVDADLERDTRSSRGLLEDHPERAAGEEVVLLAPGLALLEVVGEVERRQELLAAPVGDASEMAPFQADRSHGASDATG